MSRKTLAFFIAIIARYIRIWYNYSMISAQKLLTYFLLISLIFSNSSSFIFAKEASLHSLDELPSMQSEWGIKTAIIEDDLSGLLAEKNAFESTQQNNQIETAEPLSIIGSALAQEHEIYAAQARLSFLPSTIPTLTPTVTMSPIIQSWFSTGSVISEFLWGYNSIKDRKAKQTKKEKNSKWKTKKKKKVVGTKGTINAAMVPGTIIKNESGDIIPENALDITMLSSSSKAKAKKQFEKQMKNRGNLKKWKIEASPEGFDFGIPGTHLIFSQPIALTIDMPYATDGIIVDLLTEHAGDTDFHTTGLSVDSTTGCNPDGSATIPGSQAVVQDGQVTFYTCGASSFTMNPSGGTTGSNDIRVIVGDCWQVQLYYNNLAQIYFGNPPATGCSTGGSMDAWPVLRIGSTSYGNDFSAWTSSNTVGTTIGNTYTATSTMTAINGGRTYQLIIDWEHTAPNKFFTWSWRVIIPSGNTQAVKFYYGMDSYIAGGDANDTGYYSTTWWKTVGIYDGVANVLSAFRYISGTPWTAHQANWYFTVRSAIAGGTNFSNVIQTTGGDLGYGINWDFGTPAATTYSGTIEWRLAPYVSASIPDLIPGIGQPEWPLITGWISQIPITIDNVWNLASSGIHFAVLTIPTNITGPNSPFMTNGWSCAAQAGTTVTCTKATSIPVLWYETFNIPVTPQIGAGGSSVTFNIIISNLSDGNNSNNTAFATNAVVWVNAPGWINGEVLWLKGDSGITQTDGQPIPIWQDQSGLWNNLTQATISNQPLYRKTSQTLNFNPVVDFDGANDVLSRWDILGWSAGDFAAFIVAKEDLRQNNNIFQFQWSNPRISAHYPWWDGNIYWDFGVCCGADRVFVSAPFTAGTPTIGRFANSLTATIRQEIWVNGRIIVSDTTGVTQASNQVTLGSTYNGKIAEFIVYKTDLWTAQKNRIESYLAIKYGITLDQTTPTNYIFANGATASWNATLAWAYNRDIAWIARDDLTSLNQLKSQSINNSWDIIVNTVASSIESNARALIWANNWSSVWSFSTTDAPASYQRINREWQFQEKNGDIGNVKISYPASSLPSGASNPIYMFVDGDGTFALGASVYTWILVSGNWEFTANIADMQYITFGQAGDITPPSISSASIASGTLIPHGNFALTYNYSDVGTGIDPATAIGQIYSWNSGTLSYNPTPLGWYMTLWSSSATNATMNISNLPFWRYRFDMSITDNAGNSTTQSFTYFVDRIEWTISADTYNIGNIVQNVATFWTGELTVTIRTVGAGFSLTTAPVSLLTTPSGSTINYWNGTLGGGYDIWSGGTFGGSILTYSPNATLATTAKNINQNGAQNTFTYRIKYGTKVDFMQNAGDYSGMVSFGLTLDY